MTKKNYLIKIKTEAGVTELETKKIADKSYGITEIEALVNRLVNSIEFDGSPTLDVKVYEERI